jgi:hypothetical protein
MSTYKVSNRLQTCQARSDCAKCTVQGTRSAWLWDDGDGAIVRISQLQYHSFSYLERLQNPTFSISTDFILNWCHTVVWGSRWALWVTFTDLAAA